MSHYLDDVLRRERRQRWMIFGFAAFLVAVVGGLVAAVAATSALLPERSALWSA